MNGYAFEAFDERGGSVAARVALDFSAVVPEEALVERCRAMARSAMHQYPDAAPWRGWTIEMSIRLDYQTEPAVRKLSFDDLLP